MHTFTALLRGINVSGRNKIPMAELRALCADIGWHNVETYIQSGNIIDGFEHQIQHRPRRCGRVFPNVARGD